MVRDFLHRHAFAPSFRTRLGQEGIGFFIKVMHWLCQISVIELILWFPLISKYNFLCKRIGRIVHRHSSQICQNLSCCPVSFQIMECRFGCDYIVITILGNFRSTFLPEPVDPTEVPTPDGGYHSGFSNFFRLFLFPADAKSYTSV